MKANELMMENFFDVNGLIPKGLAYAVSENKNPYKEKCADV